jgi:hypothetical protein
VRSTVANVTKTVYDAFTERFGVDIVSTWALAEGPLGTMTAPGHGYRAGEIGWKRKGALGLEAADDDKLFAAKTGEVVGPVKTKDGWRIVAKAFKTETR